MTPDSWLLTPVPKITDFGLAKKLDEGSQLSRTGDVMGTPSYMAPEQAAGKVKDIGPAADIYALGAIFYELLTGRPPFRGESALDTILLLLSEDPVPPCRLQPKVPADLETICLKCLAKEPARRYASAAALADELRRYLDGAPILARSPAGVGERLAKWAWRHPAWAALVAVSVLAVAAFLATVLRSNARISAERDTAQTERDRAEKKEGEAQRSKEEAQERARELRRHLYGANVRRAYEDYEQGNEQRALELLGQVLSPPGETDLRGFEWHHLWRQTHRERKALQGPAGTRRLTFLPEGGLLAAGGEGAIKLWDLAANGEQGHTFDTAPGEWKRVAVSADGKLLALGTSAGTLTIWDVPTRRERTTVRMAADQGIQALAFSSDGRSIAAGLDNGPIKCLDVATGRVTRLANHGSMVDALAWSPDGTRLASVGDGNGLRVREASSGKELVGFEPEVSFRCVAFAPDGRTLAAADTRRHVTLFDVSAGEPLFRLTVHTPTIWALVFAPDGKTLIAGGGQGHFSEIVVWDMGPPQLRDTFKGHGAPVMALATSPDGKTLASGSADGVVKLWALAEPHAARPLRLSEPQFSLAFHPRDRLLAVPSGTTVQLWDWETREVRSVLDNFAGRVMAVAFSPDGRWLATGEGFYPAFVPRDDPPMPEGLVKIWDLTGKEPSRTLRGHRGGIFSVAFAPDGKTLASGSWDRTVKTWDPATGNLLHTFSDLRAPVRSVVYSSNGRRLAAACGDRYANVKSEVKVWEPATGTTVATFDHTGSVLSAAFAPDGRSLAAGDITGVVRLWDIDTRKERLSLEAANVLWVTGVAFAPDGKTLASVNADGSVRFWSPQTGQELAAVENPAVAPCPCLTFSPDGRWLAVGTESRRLLVLDGRPLTER